MSCGGCYLCFSEFLMKECAIDISTMDEKEVNHIKEEFGNQIKALDILKRSISDNIKKSLSNKTDCREELKVAALDIPPYYYGTERNIIFKKSEGKYHTICNRDSEGQLFFLDEKAIAYCKKFGVTYDSSIEKASREIITYMKKTSHIGDVFEVNKISIDFIRISSIFYYLPNEGFIVRDADDYNDLFAIGYQEVLNGELKMLTEKHMTICIKLGIDFTGVRRRFLQEAEMFGRGAI